MEWTKETPAPGLVVCQPARGYRYGIEVYALATFALAGLRAGGSSPPWSVIDLGSGSGVLGMLIAKRGAAVVAVERDELWIERARQSCAESGVSVDVHHADVRSWRGERVEMVVTNPPWFAADAGPTSPNPLRSVARTCLHGGVAEFIQVGLSHSERVCVVSRTDVGHIPIGAWVARRARLSKNVVCFEVRPGSGITVDEPLGDVYAEFR